MTESAIKCAYPGCGYSYPKKWAVERHMKLKHKMDLKLDVSASNSRAKTAERQKPSLNPERASHVAASPTYFPTLPVPTIPNIPMMQTEDDPYEMTIRDFEKMEKITGLVKKIQNNLHSAGFHSAGYGITYATGKSQKPVWGVVGIACRRCLTFQIKPFYTSPLETTEAIDYAKHHVCMGDRSRSSHTITYHERDWQQLQSAMALRMVAEVETIFTGPTYLYSLQTKTIPPATPPLFRMLIERDVVSDLKNNPIYINRAILNGFTQLDESELRDFVAIAEASYLVCPVRRNGETQLYILYVGPFRPEVVGVQNQEPNPRRIERAGGSKLPEFGGSQLQATDYDRGYLKGYR